MTGDAVGAPVANSVVLKPGGLDRIAYVSGPSEAAKIYRSKRNGEQPSYFGTNYMERFLCLAEEMEAAAWVETWHAGSRYRAEIDRITFMNVPAPQSRGLAYHLEQIARQLAMLVRVVRFKPKLIVLTGNLEYWWIYAAWRLLRVPVIASFHGAPKARFGRLKLHERLFLWLSARLMFRHLDAAVVTSEEIARQLRGEIDSADHPVPIFHHLPTYDRRQFEDIHSADRLPTEIFRIFFAGRMEANKGVFDVAEMAERLRRTHPGKFVFELCGDGNDLKPLIARIASRNLGQALIVHGYSKPAKMRQIMGRCHIAIVPTRAEVSAGFEMTCAEAILSGRPLVTSAVCPALHYLGDAALEVAPDDVEGYAEAIIRLQEDRALFLRLRAACAVLSEQFYDPLQSWDQAMRRAILGLAPPDAVSHERELDELAV